MATSSTAVTPADGERCAPLAGLATAGQNPIDVRLLRYFIVVAEELHFRRATERLCIAQPPLSRAIKSLEARLGLELFDRGSDGVSLTYPGSVLLGHSRAVLAGHANLVNEMDALRNDHRARLTLGFAGAAAGLWPTALIRQIGLSHPEVSVRLVDIAIGADASAVERRAVDIAVLSSPTEFPAGLAHLVLTKSPVLIATARRPRDAGPARDDRASTAPTIAIRGVSSNWPASGAVPAPPPDIVASSYEEALDHVAADNGKLLTLATCAQRHARLDVKHLPLPGIPQATIYLAWRAAEGSAYATEACCSAASALVVGCDIQ
ncbi:MAG TPA: LysR family transcriptional regulator [Solirubrobacteraceae bacterium]|nr:LysR family transcriptional regulator [Solirubrobacteraceae bacterium]